jgi:hypothetical protein
MKRNRNEHNAPCSHDFQWFPPAVSDSVSSQASRTMANMDESPGRYSNAQSVIQWPKYHPDCAIFANTKRHRRSVCQIPFQMDGSNVPKHLLEGSHQYCLLHWLCPELQSQFADKPPRRFRSVVVSILSHGYASFGSFRFYGIEQCLHHTNYRAG